MNHTEADALAKRIINTWRGGPPLAEWTSALLDLDAGTAGTAFIRCRNQYTDPPTIAAFVATYRTLSTRANQPTGEHCGCGDGLVAVWIERGGRQIRCAAPCTCPLGRARAPQIADIASRSALSEPDPTTPRERVDHIPADLFHQEPTP